MFNYIFINKCFIEKLFVFLVCNDVIKIGGFGVKRFLCIWIVGVYMFVWVSNMMYINCNWFENVGIIEKCYWEYEKSLNFVLVNVVDNGLCWYLFSRGFYEIN